MSTDLKNIIESLIFMSTEPITKERIKDVLHDFREKDIDKALQTLIHVHSSGDSGIHLVQAAGGYLFSTSPECDEWIRRLLHVERKTRLSPASIETLSTVAYHQPITLAQISAIRGVDSTHSLKTLLAKGLVKITGRKKGPGKPLIYRTSDKFLAYFGLGSLEELPTHEEIATFLEEEENLER